MKLSKVLCTCVCVRVRLPVCFFACLCPYTVSEWVSVRSLFTVCVCLCVVAVPNEINEDRLCHDNSLQRDEWPWIGKKSVTISI